MNKPRAVTPEELRAEVIRRIHECVGWWLNDTRVESVQEKLEGLAFTILAELDGSSVILPAFELVARPHPDDKEYLKTRGQNWIEDGTAINCLHEFFHSENPMT